MTEIKLKGVIIYTSEEFEYLNEKENKQPNQDIVIGVLTDLDSIVLLMQSHDVYLLNP